MEQSVKTRQQIADEYGIGRKTLYRWLKQEGIILRGKSPLSFEEQERIYATFGHPPHIRNTGTGKNLKHDPF